MTHEQLDEFEERGVIKLPGLIARELVDRAADHATRVLERAGAMRDGAWLAERATDVSLRTRLTKRLKPLAKEPAFGDLVTRDVVAMAHSLAGGVPLTTLVGRPQILFTPPDAETWTVPHKIWHLDFPRLGSAAPPGVQMFAMLRPLPPGGGGTLVVAGSHRLVNDRGFVSSKEVKKALVREPWFAALLRGGQPDRERFVREPGLVGDVPVQVVEMHGEPGDVYMVDLRMLHTLAPNASDAPRLMITQRFVQPEVLQRIWPRDDASADEVEAVGS